MGANVSGAERAVTMKAGFDASTNVLRFSFHFTSTRSNYEFGLRNLRAETSLGTIYHGQASRPQASLKSGVIAFRMRRFSCDSWCDCASYRRSGARRTVAFCDGRRRELGLRPRPLGTQVPR